MGDFSYNEIGIIWFFYTIMSVNMRMRGTNTPSFLDHIFTHTYMDIENVTYVATVGK